MKTNAARRLDELGIPYATREYEVTEALDATTVAHKIGLPPEQVFKTLVARGDKNGVCFAVIDATAELDLKALARLSGDRTIALVPLKDVQPLTGYVRGGVTALAAKKDYPVYADELISLHEMISVSGGHRGLQLLLSPSDYVNATRATVGPISRATASRS